MKKVSYTFLYKEAKSSKLKWFLITKHFFSHFTIFSFYYINKLTIDNDEERECIQKVIK